MVAREMGRDGHLDSKGSGGKGQKRAKVDIWRAIQEGGLSAQRTRLLMEASLSIRPELFRVFEAQGPEQTAMEQDANTAIEKPWGKLKTSVHA